MRYVRCESSTGLDATAKISDIHLAEYARLIVTVEQSVTPCQRFLFIQGQNKPLAARIIDGKTIAADLRGKVKDAAHRLLRDRSLLLGIAVVPVGENPASEIYVRNKSKAAVEAGMRAFDHKLTAHTSEASGSLMLLAAKLGFAILSGALLAAVVAAALPVLLQ
jgi:hypothetical protein